MESLPELRAREDEIARQWEWLQDALNELARVRAEQGDAEAFRLLQGQAMAIGQRRVHIWMQMAELEGADRDKQKRGYGTPQDHRLRQRGLAGGAESGARP